jgi:hypothetical protein
MTFYKIIHLNNGDVVIDIDHCDLKLKWLPWNLSLSYQPFSVVLSILIAHVCWWLYVMQWNGRFSQPYIPRTRSIWVSYEVNPRNFRAIPKFDIQNGFLGRANLMHLLLWYQLSSAGILPGIWSFPDFQWLETSLNLMACCNV